MVEVRLLGRETPFGAVLAERLERVGIDTKSDDGIHICCWDGGGGGTGQDGVEAANCDLYIRPSTAPESSGEHACTLILHDLFIPSGVGSWGPSEITDRLEWLAAGVDRGDDSGADADADGESRGESPPGSPRHWVHVRDAVDAVASLLDNLPTGQLDMCGRRCWSHQAMSEELDMLWARFQAAVDHSFKIEHLVVSEPKTEPAERVERADLGPLHAALEEAGTMGWHPLVPFRVGLMECIAHSRGE